MEDNRGLFRPAGDKARQGLRVAAQRRNGKAALAGCSVVALATSAVCAFLHRWDYANPAGAALAVIALVFAALLLGTVIRSSRIPPADVPLLPAYASGDRGESPWPPPVHTLVTVAPISRTLVGRGPVDAPGEIVLSAGTGGRRGSTVPISSSRPAHRLPVRTQIDRVVFERIDEFRSVRGRRGCVLLLTETSPRSLPVARETPTMNGALAALSFANMLAGAAIRPTLLLDVGSRAWSRFPDQTQPVDVIAFPRTRGFYEIVSGLASLEDCLLFDDEAPGLMAITPGGIPHDWAERLADKAALEILQRSREIAAAVVVYGPRCQDNPNIVRALARVSDAVLLISGVGPTATFAEQRSLGLLRDARPTIFGRIALVASADLGSVVGASAGSKDHADPAAR